MIYKYSPTDLRGSIALTYVGRVGQALLNTTTWPPEEWGDSTRASCPSYNSIFVDQKITAAQVFGIPPSQHLETAIFIHNAPVPRQQKRAAVHIRQIYHAY